MSSISNTTNGQITTHNMKDPAPKGDTVASRELGKFAFGPSTFVSNFISMVMQPKKVAVMVIGATMSMPGLAASHTTDPVDNAKDRQTSTRLPDFHISKSDPTPRRPEDPDNSIIPAGEGAGRVMALYEPDLPSRDVRPALGKNTSFASAYMGPYVAEGDQRPDSASVNEGSMEQDPFLRIPINVKNNDPARAKLTFTDTQGNALNAAVDSVTYRIARDRPDGKSRGGIKTYWTLNFSKRDGTPVDPSNVQGTLSARPR